MTAQRERAAGSRRRTRSPLARIARSVGLYFIFARWGIKKDLNLHWLSLLMNVTTRFASQLVSLAFLWVLFGKIAALGKWSMEGVAFVFAFQSLCAGVTEFLIGDLWGVSDRLTPGGLDTVLAFPASPLLQVVNMGAGSGNVKALGAGALGLVLMIVVTPALGIPWDLVHVLYLVGMLASGGLIYFGLSLTLISFTFWTKETIPLFVLVGQLIGFSRYPLDIYPRVVQVILTWVLPFAFTGFYPALFYLTGGVYGPLMFLGPPVALGFTALGLALWRMGLRRYETGV